MLNTYQVILSEKKVLCSNQLILKFLLITPKEIIFKAGQYLILKIQDQNRLYSIFSSPSSKNNFNLMVKLIPNGLASNYINNLQVNDKIIFQGPAGIFTLRENQKDKIFFATYTGLAPIWSIIANYFEKNPASQINLNLFWGLRNYEEICFLEKLKQMTQKYSNFKFFICLSQEKNLDKISAENQKYFKLGRVNTVWEQTNNLAIKPLINQSDYYLCGSRLVVEGLNQSLLEKGITKENILFEKF